MRGAAAVLVSLLLAAVTVLGIPLPAQAAAAPVAALVEVPEGTVPVGGPVSVEVEQVGASSSAVLRRGEALPLRVRVSDSSGEPLEGVRVLVSASSRALTSSAALQRWAQGQGPSRGDVVLEDVGLAGLTGPSPLPPPDAAAAAREPDPVVVDVSADPEQTRRLGQAWGPRGLTVEVVDAEGTRLAAQRTFVTWLPSGEPLRSGRTALVVPLSAGAPDIASAEVPPQRLQALVAPGGRLDRALAVAALPGSSWVVDPAVLGEPPAGAGTRRPAPTGAPGPQEADDAGARAAARTWRERLAATAPGHDVAVLPYGSPDVAALSAAGTERLYALAEERGRAAAAVLGGSATLTRTAEDTLTAAAVRTAAQDGRDVVLLAGGEQGGGGPRVDLRARAVGQDGASDGAAASVSALVPSAAATRVLVEGTSQRDPQRPAAPRPTPAMTAARLVAESAVATLASGEQGPGALLMAPPPGWDVDPALASAVLGPVQAAPWARPVGLEALAASPGTPRTAGPTSAQRGQLPAGGLVAVQAALARATAGAAALSTPDGYLEASQASAAAAASSAWEDDPGAWQAGIDAFGRSSSRVAEQVRVVPGSTVTVLASKVDLPVTVVNNFDRSVDVTVSLDSSSGRLQGAGDVPVVALAPGDRQRVLVPVTAVASGDVTAQVVLRARDGTRIGEPVRLDVVVRADWEDRGTVVAAAVVALVLLVGVVRTVRRNRRGGRSRPGRGGGARPPAPPGSPDDDPGDGLDGGDADVLSGAGSAAGGRR